MKKKYYRSLLIGVLFSFFISMDSQATQFMANGLRLQKKIKPLRELKRENVVTQSLDFSCGAAGLSTLLNFYLSDDVSEEEVISRLLEVVPIEKVRARRGFSLYDLKLFAEERGYKVTGYKMDLDFLKDLNSPVLVPVKFKNYRHFVVVRGVLADRVFLADPAAGNVSMKINQFKKIWVNGIGLVVEHKNIAQTSSDLNIKEEDFVFANYQNIRRLVSQGMISTTFYPNEW